MSFTSDFTAIMRTSLTGGILALMLSACATPLTSDIAATSEATEVAPTVISYKKGELISLISIVSKEGDAAKKAVANYYATAFPLGETHGLIRKGQLKVKAVPVGAHKSEGVVFYSWPSKAAEDAFSAEPAWPAIKAARPEAWTELRIYTDEVKDDITFTFHADKTYTLAMAWINPENPTDYDRYMEGIKDAVAESGGRFVYKMFDPKFESHNITDGGPGQVTLVEWDTPRGLQAFGKTDGFRANAAYLTSGVTRFEILALGTQ